MILQYTEQQQQEQEQEQQKQQKMSTPTTAKPNMFSSQVQMALSQLSSKFGSDINQAFQTVPATRERAKEVQTLKANPLAALVAKQELLQQNERAIMKDMELLHQAKVLGENAVFHGFTQLGNQDYLGNYLGDSEESDSDYDSDDSDDSDDDDSAYQAPNDGRDEFCFEEKDEEVESGDDDSDSDSESDSDDDDSSYGSSDFDSDYDSDDDSSLGSLDGMMDEMQNKMGIILPDELLKMSQGYPMDGQCASVVSMTHSFMSLDTNR
eukprot:CAMPEP_0119029564 /NCGR_PEP_ID=MMETSP1176-20130426/40582_1 /TAXON_ID=265551 /ORGANISM="Synedropsis recta cf, Strain CCMP1620" /LENGTH=265 /DNA_ID=CAMNT_0006985911 /DNA_START=45 /DNA_END=842 /DNA_ORIENTATION=+